jgi:hypothetical protein
MNMTRWRGLSPLLGIGLAAFVGLACLSTNVRGDVVTYYDSTTLTSGNQIGVTYTSPSSGTNSGVQNLTLQQLETVAAGGSGYAITINNGYDTKVFEGFTGFSSSASNNLGAGISGLTAGAITVTGLGSGDSLSPGPGLNFAGNFTAQAQGIGTQAGIQDTSFSYGVSILQPSGYAIHDIGLQMGAAFVGGATGGEIKIIESLTSPYTQTMTDLMNTAGSVTGNSYDMALLSPVATSITVNKDINLTGGTTQSSSITNFEQTFSQVAVPEPSSMAIAGLGALGLVGYGLRRRKALGA